MTDSPPYSPSEPTFSAGLARLARATIVLWAALVAVRLLAFPDGGVGPNSIRIAASLVIGAGFVVLLSLPAWQQPRRLLPVLGFASFIALAGAWGTIAKGGVFSLWTWPLMTLFGSYTLAATWQLWPAQRRHVQVLGALGVLLALGALGTRQLTHLPVGNSEAYQHLISSFMSSLAVYAVAAVCLHGLSVPRLRERTQRAALGVFLVSVAVTIAATQLATLGFSASFNTGALSGQVVALTLLLVGVFALAGRVRYEPTVLLVTLGLIGGTLLSLWGLGSLVLPLLTFLGVGLALWPRRWWPLQALALTGLAAGLLAVPGLAAPFATMYGLSALGVFAFMRHWVTHCGLFAAADTDSASVGAAAAAPSPAEAVRLNRWSLGVGLATVLAVLVGGGLALQQRSHNLAQNAEEAMVLMAEQIQRRIGRAETAAQVMVQDIREHVGSQPQALSEQAFKPMADPLSRLVGPGVQVQWAPKGVITNIYAPGGDLGALDLDLLNDPRRREVWAPIQAQGKPVWSAPFVLVEGGIGMSYTVPVFATDGGFLGFAMLLLKLPQALLPDFEHSGRTALHSVALGLQPDGLMTIWQRIADRIEGPSDLVESVSDARSESTSEALSALRMALVGAPGVAGQWQTHAAPQSPARLWLEVRASAPQNLASGLLLLQVAVGLGLLAGLLTGQVVQAQVRRQVERQSDRELTRLQAVLGESVLSMQLFSPAGQVVWYNRAALAVLHFTPDQIQGFNLWDSPMMQVPQHRAALQRTLQTGESCQFAYQGSGRFAQSLDVVVNVSRLELGGQTLILLQARDMRELHARERDLARAHTRALAARDEVQDLYDNAPCGYHSIDPQGRVLRMNQTELAWLQRSAEEVIGRPITDFMTPASVVHFAQHLPELLAGKLRQDVEFELVRADGSTFEVAINAVMMKDAADQPIMTRSTVFDITELKARERALERARDAANAANQAKSQFLSTISHEIRTPLNWLMGMLQILAYRDDLPRSAIEQVSKANKGAEVLLAVLNDMLDYSGLSSGKQAIRPAPMDLTDSLMYIRMSGEEMVMAEHVTLMVEVDPALNKKVMADDLRLRQILLNLVSNAVKFTEQGQVRLSARVLALTPEQMRVQIVVADSGIGMSQETLAKLFTPFMQADMTDTRRHGGTGLGLAISKSLLDAMGGQVAVESELGVGTTFTIDLTLPLAPEETSPATVQPSHKPAHIRPPEKLNLAGELTGQLQGLRVLVVDDKKTNVLVAESMLESMGAQVTGCLGAQIALEQLQDPAQAFDMVLMDLQMPTLDGLEATRLIRQHPDPRVRDVLVLAMTGRLLEDEREQARQAGMNGFISKPLLWRNLLSEIQRVIVERDAGELASARLASG
jgi:PAS domain S-box-containing protein